MTKHDGREYEQIEESRPPYHYIYDVLFNHYIYSIGHSLHANISNTAGAHTKKPNINNSVIVSES